MADRETPADPRKGMTIREQLGSFHATFWWANWMELVERFSYYGLRTVVPVYMVLAYEEGGPEFSHEQKGAIFGVWAMVQSFVPIFTGGFADRFGYKLNIAISTVVKIIGYLLMGYAIELGAGITGNSIAEYQGAAGDPYTYPIFFAGAIALAAGTAIFKPGVQGLIGSQMPQRARSFGWGIFYQMVNIGGFLGPFIAAYLRILDWKLVFLICAAAIALNFIPLMLFAEPRRREGEGYHGQTAGHVIKDTLRQFLHPRVFFFTISFAGFWLMFYQLFDILPNFIDDWVDSRAIAEGLSGVFGSGFVPTLENGNLPQEWMINFNAFLISIFAFAMGYVTGKIKSMPAMVIGIAICAVAIYALGMSMNGWWTLFAIGIFSFGEMTASPTKLRYMNEIAPKGKEGLYLGFANATVGIGWSIGSFVAGNLYEEGGDKANLALRDYAQDRDTAALVESLNEEEMVRGYADLLGLNNLQSLTLVYRTDAVPAADDPAGALAWYREEWAGADEARAALADVDASSPEALAAGIEAALGIPGAHVLRIPNATGEDVGDETVELAREILAGYGRTADKAGDLRRRAVVVRLSKELGVDNYAAHRVLFMPGVRTDGLDLDAMRERVRPVWEGSDEAKRVSERDLEDRSLLARTLEKVGTGQTAAVMHLVRAEELPQDLGELRDRLEQQILDESPQAAPLRSAIVAAAGRIEDLEERRDYVLGLFQRSRVVAMGAADRGMSRAEYKRYLWDTYEPYSMWTVFMAIGVGSMICMILYDLGVRRWGRLEH